LVLCALGLPALVPLACSSPADDTGAGTASSAASGTAATSAASSGSAGGGGTAAASPFQEDCDVLCEHVQNIVCTSFPGCAEECPNALGAPEECRDAFGVLLDCWLANLQKFACTAIQILPPYECYAEEQALAQCIGGQSGVDADAGCAGQVCNSSDDTCSCKTFCASSELKSACSAGDNGWVCSCYAGPALLGTCTQVETSCDNYTGCCAAYFGTD
jgi:hypothetical protein